MEGDLYQGIDFQIECECPLDQAVTLQSKLSGFTKLQNSLLASGCSFLSLWKPPFPIMSPKLRAYLRVPFGYSLQFLWVISSTQLIPITHKFIFTVQIFLQTYKLPIGYLCLGILQTPQTQYVQTEFIPLYLVFTIAISPISANKCHHLPRCPRQKMCHP